MSNTTTTTTTKVFKPYDNTDKCTRAVDPVYTTDFDTNHPIDTNRPSYVKEATTTKYVFTRNNKKYPVSQTIVEERYN